MIELVKVKPEQINILHNLLQFYIYEFTSFNQQITLEEHGLFKPFDLEDYFTVPEKHPFFIKNEEEYVGFALVESGTGEKPSNIDEFLIMRKHKGKGYGKAAATSIFEMFPGRWTVFQIERNTPAQGFWRKVIHDYTGGNYTEKTDEYKRVKQEFTIHSIMV
ncbi:GNAT family N-acetyltransferase [Peribacillus sp. SCS-155]|uniref:GNAT family N-acetyltransferase n=1 Tax=Peribacillus sedimenti TaxID=3115297 RepID=UPI0039058D5C